MSAFEPYPTILLDRNDLRCGNCHTPAINIDELVMTKVSAM
jgi:hypothetical protein